MNAVVIIWIKQMDGQIARRMITSVDSFFLIKEIGYLKYLK